MKRQATAWRQAAWQQAQLLQDELNDVAAALRTNMPDVDHHPLIVAVHHTIQTLERGPLGQRQHLVAKLMSEDVLPELMSVCNKVDAAHDAMTCFMYPNNDTATLLGSVGELLFAITTSLSVHAADDADHARNGGSDFFQSQLQRQLAPALTQLASQATAALNTAHDHLHTLPAPLVSDSLHALLLGILKAAYVCAFWGAPPGDPRPYSAIITALAREHTADAAARLLAALQDPSLVATPATFTTHAPLFNTLHALAFLLVSLLSPDLDTTDSGPLNATLALTPAARDALRTHMLSDHHLLLHILRCAAACAYAPPTPAPPRLPPPHTRASTPTPTPALPPATRKSFTGPMQRILGLAAVWLGDAHGPDYDHRWYTTCPEAVWQATADLLAAIVQPRGWRAMGPAAVTFMAMGPPLGLLETQRPELLRSVARPVVAVLLSRLQELVQRRQQLARPKALLWHLWTRQTWESREARMVACHRAAAACLDILWVLTAEEGLDKEESDAEEEMMPVTSLLRQPAVVRSLQQAQAALDPGRPPEDALVLLNCVRALMAVLDGGGPPPPPPRLDAWLQYAMSAGVAVASALSCVQSLLLLLVVTAFTVRASDLQVLLANAKATVQALWVVPICILGSTDSVTLRPALMVADACPGSVSELLALAGGWLRKAVRAGGHGRGQ